jgi:L-histidine Nalpha-methyltransferase
MSSSINVTVHASQFPECVKETLLEGLRSRRIAPKFLYQSYKQAQLWLALSRAFSPILVDPHCQLMYGLSFMDVAGCLPERRLNMVGLGCGGGQKETRLLYLLATQGKQLSYVPCDVSLPLLLTATSKAQSACPAVPCRPLLCDLAGADDLPEVLDSCGEPDARRIITFFGMMPNFETDIILPKLAALLRAEDLLLLSANLAPGPDYRAGVQRVLPGYDNPQTRAWLRAFLEDLGAEPGDGVVDFSIEEAAGLLRIVGDFRFQRERELVVHSEHFDFRSGEMVRLFFSYRHTPDRLRQLLLAHRMQVVQQWITKSEEEGVFLCRKQPGG